MQILFINILMDGPPSQSLGVDPVDHSVMRRPPRGKTAPIITQRLIYRILFSASVIVVGTLYIYIHELRDGFADQRDQTMVSAQRRRTAWLRADTRCSQTFTCFVFLDLTSAIQNRGLATPLLGNRMLITTVSASLVTQLALVYFPLLQGVFQTTGLDLGDLFLLVFIAGLAFGAHELRRRYERRLGLEEADWEGSMA
jgi:Ca2+-transporting ATPase